MPADTRRIPTRYPVIAALAVLAVLVGLGAPRLASPAAGVSTASTPAAAAAPAAAGAVRAVAGSAGRSSTGSAHARKNLSAKDRIAADPPPALLPDSALEAVQAALAAQAAPASGAMRAWWAAHGATRDDAAFLTWVQTQVPSPPSTAERSSELADVQALAAARTPAGVKAATWLEVHGKKDIWELYMHDQRELLPTKAGNADKAEEKAILKMAKKAADTLSSRFKESAPYVLDPSLRPEKKVARGATCPCSYPSVHAARAAASVALLAQLDPRRRSEYTWMQAEVAYSRMYMAGHVLSDISAGTRLGDMIGEYFLVTRGHVAPPA